MCPKGHVIPDEQLTRPGWSCPTCAAKNSRQALYDSQAEFLRKVVNAAFGYSLRVTKTPHHHVLMFGSPTHTFCDQELPLKHALMYQPYTDETLSKVCPGCRSAIAEAVTEALV